MMRPISAIMPGVLSNIAAANVDLSLVQPTRRPIFVVEGAKVLDRRTRRWMTVDQATQEMLRLAVELAAAEDPGLLIPVVSAWPGPFGTHGKLRTTRCRRPAWRGQRNAARDLKPPHACDVGCRRWCAV